jgi:hypothetical protein
MKQLTASALLAIIFLTACVPQEALTQTAVAQTQSFEARMATSLVGTMTAIAPTATDTVPPPTKTSTPVPSATPLPSPTPSGKFELYDVSVKQLSPDEVAVSLGYQIKTGTKLSDILIGAWPEGCGTQLQNMSFNGFAPSSYSGLVAGDSVIKLSIMKPGGCDAKSILVFVFVPNSYAGNLYQKSFKIPVSLKKP